MNEQFISSFSDEMEKIASIFSMSPTLSGKPISTNYLKSAIKGYAPKILGGAAAGGIWGSLAGAASTINDSKENPIDVKKRILKSSLAGGAAGGLVGGLIHKTSVNDAKNALNYFMKKKGVTDPKTVEFAQHVFKPSIVENPIELAHEFKMRSLY
jgi:hypothetical protein